MELHFVGRQKVGNHFGFEQLGEEAHHGQHRENMEAIADEAVLSLSLQGRVPRHRVKTAWGDTHQLGPLRRQRLPPLLILPRQGALLVRRGRKPPGIRKEAFHRCSRRTRGPVSRVEKLSGKRVHGARAPGFDHYLRIQQRPKALMKEALVGEWFLAHIGQGRHSTILRDPVPTRRR